jgi:copper oxidase (laccase) domain-containing protein
MEQVHGSDIKDIHADEHLSKDNCLVKNVDGVFLADKVKNTVVGVKVADCIPVFVVSNGILLGAFHAGWRGISEKIGEKFVKRAILNGFDKNNMSFYAGPHICEKCLEMGDEVKRIFPGTTIKGNYLNLFKALKLQLAESGINANNVKLLKTEDYCTYENPSYYSHRQGDPQRMIAFAIQYRN